MHNVTLRPLSGGPRVTGHNVTLGLCPEILIRGTWAGLGSACGCLLGDSDESQSLELNSKRHLPESLELIVDEGTGAPELRLAVQPGMCGGCWDAHATWTPTWATCAGLMH